MLNGDIVKRLETEEHSSSNGSVEEMPRRRKTRKPTKKKIYNPWTRTWYSIRQRSTVKGKRGTIKGKLKRPKKKRGS